MFLPVHLLAHCAGGGTGRDMMGVLALRVCIDVVGGHEEEGKTRVENYYIPRNV